MTKIIRVIMKNYYKARVAITYLVLGAFGLLAILSAVFSGAGIYIAQIIGVSLLAACLAVIARRLKEKEKYSWKKLANDLGFIFKITMGAMITMLQGLSGACMVGALLVFEKSDLIPKKSLMGK